MDEDTKVIVLALSFFFLILMSIFLLAEYDAHSVRESVKMQTCIENGNEWVYRSGHHSCIKP